VRDDAAVAREVFLLAGRIPRRHRRDPSLLGDLGPSSAWWKVGLRWGGGRAG
jgi:hypothetical protein